MGDKIAKCGKTRWCSALDESLEPEENARAKGLATFVTTNFGTSPRKRTLYGITFKKAASDRGMILNYCPWCGVKFASIVPALAKVEAAS
jgi:hypothetical protein